MKIFSKVSIIIPCYNDSKYISETINCIRSQTYSNWECILINDGSTDKTEEIILKKISNDSRFVYLYQENKGVCIARNNAIREANGEYILCLDGNDLISSNFIEETSKILDSNFSIAIATSRIKIFGKKNKLLNLPTYKLQDILAENQLVVSSMFRRTDFDNAGGFNTNMKHGFEDWDLWISILKNNQNIQCATNAIFYYRILSSSRNIMTFEKQQKLRFQLWQNHKELYGQYFVNPVLTFEYKIIAYSPEYKIGSLLLKPLRTIKKWLFVIQNKIGSK